MARILIIDDDKDLCSTISKILSREGHEPACFHTLGEGLAKARGNHWDLVFLDVMMPDGIGLDIISELTTTASRPEVIIMTSDATEDGAQMALQQGAWDYIQKPFTVNELRLAVSRVIQYREEKDKSTSQRILRLKEIVWRGPEMEHCIDLLAKAAFCDANVLITGETGTGKELFARAIHENSRRSEGNFVVLDCAALPENLVESTLFGHEKGAFTGADRPYEGLLSQAHGGTLFLDEVGELPAHIQKTFLRALQERRFRRVGGAREISSDFRLITATNRDLDKMVSDGLFRSDLLFRLRSVHIQLPPLRGRSTDIKELAIHYIMRFADRYGTGVKGFAPEFLEALFTYDWPGNVRELVNAIERAYAAAGDEPTFFPIHLPDHIRIYLAQSRVRAEREKRQLEDTNVEISGSAPPTLREAVEMEEKRYLEGLLRATSGDTAEACRISGLSRSTFYEKLRRHGISTRLGQDAA